MNNLANKTTFWAFLKQTQIRIPIIQRDYAQGRKGKENLRENFLSSIGTALSGGPQLKLDFVYGSGDGAGHFSPLDGQQRLTTLWLLHWYLAYKTGELKQPKIQGVFQRFSYETRESSKAFIRMLVEKGSDIQQNKNERIADAIIRQSWMFTSWRQDPTVQSMLRMLSGEENDKTDGIEELFEKKGEDDLKEYWDALLKDSDTSPVIFYQLDIDNLGQSDDLYVKMNGRGKPLTDFENFKADLFKYFEDNNWSEDFLHPETGFPILMDTKWTDFFWDYKQKEIPFDDLYFTFINRFFLSELMLWVPGLDNSKAGDKVYSVYEYLYSFIEDKTQRKPFTEIGFGIYRDLFDLLVKKGYNGKETIHGLFSRLRTLLNNISAFKKAKGTVPVNSPYYPDKTFEPVYVRINKPGSKQDYYSLTQPQMVVFWAMCYFFEQDFSKFSNYDDANDQLKKWMRLVWNTCDYNDEIRNRQAVISAIKEFKRLVADPLDSHQSLLATEAKSSSSDESEAKSGSSDESAFGLHIREEREKIKKMDQNGNSSMYNGTIIEFSGKSWEEVILTVEKNTYLTGTMRCLVLNDNNQYVWEDFETKYPHFKLYSDQIMDHIAIRNYLVHDFERRSDTWYIEGSSKDIKHWKELLSDKDRIKNVHEWLVTDPLDEQGLAKQGSSRNDGEYRYEYQKIIGSPLMDLVKNDWGIHMTYSGSCKKRVLLHHQASPIPYVLMYESRNETVVNLLNAQVISLLKPENWISDPEVQMWKAKDLGFSYKDRDFTWTGDGKIRLKDSDPVKEHRILDKVYDVNEFELFMDQF